MKRLAAFTVFSVVSLPVIAGAPPIAMPAPTSAIPVTPGTEAIPSGAIPVYPCWDYMDNGVPRRVCGSFQGGQIMVNAAEWQRMKEDMQAMRQQIMQVQQSLNDMADPIGAARRKGYIK